MSRKSEKLKWRAEVFAKSDGHCYLCGKPIDILTFTIEHCVPRQQEGGDELENLMPSCKTCNSRKGTRTIEEYRNYVATRLVALQGLLRETLFASENLINPDTILDHHQSEVNLEGALFDHHGRALVRFYFEGDMYPDIDYKNGKEK